MMDFLLATESAEKKVESWQSRSVAEAQRIVTEQKWSNRYPELVRGLESADPKVQARNAHTAILMFNQAQFMDHAKRSWGESTVKDAA